MKHICDWDRVRCLNAVAETGSLADAARQLGISTATAGRWIDSLEADVGVKLFRRGRSGSRLTDAGKACLEFATAPRAAMQEFERKLASLSSDAPRRRIRISAVEPVVAEMLAPSLHKLPADMQIELISSASVANLNDPEIDLAVRMFRPQEHALVARRIAIAPMGLFASRRFLRGRKPERLDLRREPLLMVTPRYGNIAETQWGEVHGYTDHVRLYCSSSRALLLAAQSGAGIAIAATFQARKLDLVEIPCAPIPSREFWLVAHSDTRSVATTRIVKKWIVDAITEAIGSGT
jgi:molybdate transport repressor ModE-like protein